MLSSVQGENVLTRNLIKTSKWRPVNSVYCKSVVSVRYSKTLYCLYKCNFSEYDKKTFVVLSKVIKIIKATNIDVKLYVT